MKYLIIAIVLFGHHLLAAEPQRFDLSKRASEIDPRAKEHPEIKFTFTDDKGNPADIEHAVVDTRVLSQGKLVIWLMGHNQQLFERISSYGYHGIQPHYANGWFAGLSKIQYEDGSGTAIGNIRLEAATGEDFSSLVRIPKPDGMMERSLQFVKWLAKENPDGKWEQFLTADGGDLRWEKVIMSGISHGSTTAARFAMHQKVDRVVMFSGPRDNTEIWQGGVSATPSNRFFGFSHVLDGGWVADHYCRSWQLLKMHNHGPVVSIDAARPPYGNTRRLISNSDVQNNSKRAHTIVVPGGKDAVGQWVYDEVFRYLFTHAVDQSAPPVPVDADCEMDQLPN
ncbi:MAG: hypothetical protein KGS60_18590 [Verrucomicrobia bacterium]|nr:hypothetical protein [Verrucomicrobiota bacterium]